MLKVAGWSIMIPGILFFVFLFAMMPVLLQASPIDGTLQLSWEQGFQSLKDYFAGLGNGDSFQFYSGKNERSFWEWIGSYFVTSFYYVAAAGVAGTAIGLFVGIYFSLSEARITRSIVDFVGSLPDFVIVLIMQFAVVLVAREFDVVLFEVATLNSEEPAIALPLIAMIIIPANYMIRGVAMQMRLTLKEDYIGNAKARGLGKLYIVFYHALPNVLPFVKGDLHKLMGIIMGNLFIVEYLFNNNGVSMLIFTNAFVEQSGIYQYNIVVNGLLSFLALYLAGYAVIRAFLFLLGRVFLR
ncbi:ABC transporter permease subunit [Paenibacillus soyae]|uniref:ABC transporter permease subunit n=1 Tax=Paenibacillus soyae TaxID=2969249 RepID=A0A9X2MNN6_9BACL|nr:ABC transporter permease subunit [Paenibacillus soyae]MCR2804084.1 ABC transporter permease subunit [Paenibacillus soyae]